MILYSKYLSNILGNNETTQEKNLGGRKKKIIIRTKSIGLSTERWKDLIIINLFTLLFFQPFNALAAPIKEVKKAKYVMCSRVLDINNLDVSSSHWYTNLRLSVFAGNKVFSVFY